MSNELQIPPHSIEAEEGCLAACLLADASRDSIEICLATGLSSGDFFKEAHKLIYENILEIYKRDEPVDEIVLFDQLSRSGKEEETGGLSAIYHIQGRIETAAHCRYHAKIVKDKSGLRQLIQLTRKTTEACYKNKEDAIALATKLEGAARTIAELEAAGSDVVHVEPIVASERSKLIERIRNPEAKIEGIVPTHLVDLNFMFDYRGFMPGQMIVLAARPSVGKSALAGNFADHAAVNDDTGTLVFNLEMTADQCVNRMVAARSRVNSQSIKRADFRFDQQKHVAEAYKAIEKAPLYFDDSSSNTIADIRAKALKTSRILERLGKRLGLIVIDYLQLIRPVDPKMPRVQQIGEISRGTKRLAKELSIPVIILSQLNRSSEREGRRPRMSDLREAGDIEQDADVIILLHREDREPDPVDGSVPDTDIQHIKAIIEKQRDGKCGDIDLTFVAKYTRFENFSR